MSNITRARMVDGDVISKVNGPDGGEDEWDEAALRRSRLRSSLAVQGTRLTFLAVLFGVWEFSSGRFVDPFWISSPSEILSRLWEWLADGTIVTNLAFTLQAMIYGFVIGAIAGVAGGFLLGRIRFLARVVDPMLVAVYSLPKIALAPLFILWFGIGLTSKVVLTAMIVFFLVFYNTYSGVREVDRDLVDVVRLMGGSKRDILQRIVLPSSAAWIFTGLRLAVPYSLVGAIVGELVASNEGIGYILRRSSGLFDTTGVFTSLIVLMFVSTTLNIVVNKLESRTTRWKQSSTV